MSVIDAFYTPCSLAKKMVRLVKQEPRVVADFTCGNGELLRAAAQRWPLARYIATDISHTAVQDVRKLKCQVNVGRCDFLSRASRVQCGALRSLEGQADLVLLNPPFSCRGGKRLTFRAQFGELRCGTAMAFLLASFEYLAPSGEIVAILPAGSIDSEKDREAWVSLREVCNIEVVSEHDHRTFGSCDSTTRIVHLKRLAGKSASGPCSFRELKVRHFDRGQQGKVTLYRGKVQMHAVPRGKVPLAHSTDLKNHKLVLNGHRTNSDALGVKGTFIALPRVGSPTKEKVALHRSDSRIAISDCILALACDTPSRTTRLHASLLENWSLLKAQYGGTGAKFLTVSNLASFLRGLGYEVVPHEGAKHQLKRSISSDSHCPKSHEHSLNGRRLPARERQKSAGSMQRRQQSGRAKPSSADRPA